MSSKITIASLIDHFKQTTIYHRTMYENLVSSNKITPDFVNQANRKEAAILNTLLFCEAHEKDIRNYIASKNTTTDNNSSKDMDLESFTKGTTHCCTLLSSVNFQNFIYEKASRTLEDEQAIALPIRENKDYYAHAIRALLKIKSRSEISKDKEAFKRWRTLYEEFKAEQAYDI